MLHGINALAVLVAGLAFFVLGAIWYTLLGKVWAKEAGVDWENPGGNVPLIFGLTFVCEVLAAAVIASLLHTSGMAGTLAGVHFGLLTGIGISCSLLAVNYLFQRRSLKLYLIDAGHIVLGLAIVGAIVGAWR